MSLDFKVLFLPSIGLVLKLLVPLKFKVFIVAVNNNSSCSITSLSSNKEIRLHQLCYSEMLQQMHPLLHQIDESQGKLSTEEAEVIGKIQELQKRLGLPVEEFPAVQMCK